MKSNNVEKRFSDYSDGESKRSVQSLGCISCTPSTAIVSHFIQHASKRDSIVLDCFGSLARDAVIAVNREQGQTRSSSLIEQGEYFSTVIKPRIQKGGVFAQMETGKPLSDHAAFHCFGY